MIRAGLPTATQKSGSTPVTTEPAPTATLRPICAPGSTTVPCPSHDPAPTVTGRDGANCWPIGVSGSS